MKVVYVALSQGRQDRGRGLHIQFGSKQSCHSWFRRKGRNMVETGKWVLQTPSNLETQQPYPQAHACAITKYPLHCNSCNCIYPFRSRMHTHVPPPTCGPFLFHKQFLRKESHKSRWLGTKLSLLDCQVKVCLACDISIKFCSICYSFKPYHMQTAVVLHVQ